MSMNTEIYQDISTRTAGDIYIGYIFDIVPLSICPDFSTTIATQNSLRA